MIKRLFLSLVLLLFFSVASHAAITVGNATSADASSTNPATLTHDNASADFLLAGMQQETSGSGNIGNNATYNSVGMSLIETEVSEPDIVAARMNYLVSPSSGSNTLSWTLATEESDQTIWAVSFTGVDSSTPLGETGTQVGTTGNPSVTITSTTANSVLVMFVSRDTTAALTENSGNSWINRIDQSDGGARGQVYTLQTTSAGNYAFNLNTGGGSDQYTFIWAELLPSGGAPAAKKRRVIMQ